MPTPFNELEFVRWLQTRISPAVPQALGIGDDCADLDWRSRGRLLVTTDMLMEGSCFVVDDDASLYRIGRKALAVNLSDAAAMGGRPAYALVGLGIPRSYSLERVKSLYEGMISMAREFQTSIVGGDTNVWDGPLTISVTLMADSESRVPITRSGALVGDRIFVTGPLGGSIHGKHLDFTPRVREAMWLTESFALHSMIDISDGLLLDLSRICAASGVGALVQLDQVPIAQAAKLPHLGKTPLERALSDGEDFELLFTCSSGEAPKVIGAVPTETFAGGFRLVDVGIIQSRDQGFLGMAADGKIVPLKAQGYVHKS